MNTITNSIAVNSIAADSSTKETRATDNATVGSDQALLAERRQQLEPRSPAWLPWRCRGWPSTADEERTFAFDVSALSTGFTDRYRRADLTAVINALRGGLTVCQLLSAAPGLKPDHLRAAYVAVDDRRRASETAWNQFVQEPSIDALGRFGESAALLLPVIIHRLESAARLAPDSFAEVAHGFALSIVETGRDINSIEAGITKCANNPFQAVELGLLIYDPFGDALIARSDHLAERVGTLTSTCVSALLGERPNTSGVAPARDLKT
jgi:hypothetical protein